MNYGEVSSAVAEVGAKLVGFLPSRWRVILIVGATIFVGLLVCDIYLGERLSETTTPRSTLSGGHPTLRDTKPYLMWATLVFMLISLVVYAIWSKQSNGVASRLP